VVAALRSALVPNVAYQDQRIQGHFFDRVVVLRIRPVKADGVSELPKLPLELQSGRRERLLQIGEELAAKQTGERFHRHEEFLISREIHLCQSEDSPPAGTT